MNDGVEIRMETVITGVYGDGSVIDNNAAGCMEAVLFRLEIGRASCRERV